ncbi:MAG: hypothetical protein R3239_03830 [Thermodesulfobacteriota bacterium]|nr:hypothetical protein [Thermodesulfobacteriota bacterium]
MRKSSSVGRLLRGMVLASLIIPLIGISGCASGRIPFTQHLRNRYGLEEGDLKKLQYYVSGNITLQRGFRREEGEISGTHRLVQKEEGIVEEVFIPAGTPGIATEVGPTSLSVSFEPGRSLTFGSPPDDRDPERKYTLSARRWEDYYGELVYDDKTYFAVQGSGHVWLEVRAESLDTVKKKTKVLPGMTLPAE